MPSVLYKEHFFLVFVLYKEHISKESVLCKIHLLACKGKKKQINHQSFYNVFLQDGKEKAGKTVAGSHGSSTFDYHFIDDGGKTHTTKN